MTASKRSAHSSFWDLAYEAGDHLRHWEPPQVPAELVEVLERGGLRPGQVVLDIGCGAGLEAVFLATRGYSAIGVDSSPVALALARHRAVESGVEVDWREGRAERLPVADNAVDFALDRGCFHVVGRRRRRLYAKEVARVLRPGGAFLLRAAAEDDEEMGLIGVRRAALERLFGARGLVCEEFSDVTLEACSGNLPGIQALLVLPS